MISDTEGAKWCGEGGLWVNDIVCHMPKGINLLVGNDIASESRTPNDIRHRGREMVWWGGFAG